MQDNQDVSRKEIITWINNFEAFNISKLDHLGTG